MGYPAISGNGKGRLSFLSVDSLRSRYVVRVYLKSPCVLMQTCRDGGMILDPYSMWICSDWLDHCWKDGDMNRSIV